jgi:hypothetical protein
MMSRPCIEEFLNFLLGKAAVSFPMGMDDFVATPREEEIFAIQKKFMGYVANAFRSAYDENKINPYDVIPEGSVLHEESEDCWCEPTVERYPEADLVIHKKKDEHN